jgi:hypothetical protein
VSQKKGRSERPPSVTAGSFLMRKKREKETESSFCDGCHFVLKLFGYDAKNQ